MRTKTNRFEMWTAYYVISATVFALSYELVDYIQKQNASRGLRYALNLGPDLALFLLALVVVVGSFMMLQHVGALIRWTILILIAAGVTCSIILSLLGDLDRRIVAAVYVAPQLLLLFVRKRGDNQPSEIVKDKGSPGTKASS
jgi:hypothetical protein